MMMTVFLLSGNDIQYNILSLFPMSNNKSNDDNLLREVIGDYKNDKKTQKNLNEEGENDEYAELYRTGRGSDA